MLSVLFRFILAQIQPVWKNVVRDTTNPSIVQEERDVGGPQTNGLHTGTKICQAGMDIWAETIDSVSDFLQSKRKIYLAG